MGKGSRKKSSDKLKALIKTQQINEMLSKSLTESEALQNSGDDRPAYESHVTDLLDGTPSTLSKKASKKGTGLHLPSFLSKKKPSRR